MDKLTWNEQLNISVEVIGNVHANIFRIAGRMIEMIEDEKKLPGNRINGPGLLLYLLLIRLTVFSRSFR